MAESQEKLIREKSNSEKKFELYAKIVQIQEDMRKFTSYYSAIYDNTAEIKARDKTVDFCMLNYSYLDGNPIFDADEEDFQKRAISQYEKVDDLRGGDESEFWSSVIDRFVFLFTIWYLDLAQTEEEFQSYYDSYFKEEQEPLEEAEEETVEEPAEEAEEEPLEEVSKKKEG